MKKRRLIFTVTNDLTYDQRMQRICESLARNGYDVLLVGRQLPGSLPRQQQPFQQIRLYCFFKKGPWFYLEYNIRLLIFLIFRRADGICAIDLDTILPVLLSSRLKRIPRIYDAHEYFTELKEVRTRPRIRSFWLRIERLAVPRFPMGYTVSPGLAAMFEKQYGVSYAVVRNLPVLKTQGSIEVRERHLIYTGAVNEGRGFEYLIPALANLPYRLVVCGDGNYMLRLRELIRQYGVEDRVELRGMLLPEALAAEARSATVGLGLADREGINQYFALPNKFFDYMHAGLPQLAMNYPEYRSINEQLPVAVLLDRLDVDEVARAIRQLMENKDLLGTLRQNCEKARQLYCWQEEEKVLLQFYRNLFVHG
jgi:glycosyltransferase involved in cell wall biosynthesis